MSAVRWIVIDGSLVRLSRRSASIQTFEDLQLLEETILRYVPAWEREQEGYRERGLAQFDLLSSIPTELRSRRVSARIDELERKVRGTERAPERGPIRHGRVTDSLRGDG